MSTQNYNKLTIDTLPLRVELYARDRKLKFDLPAWEEFKKDTEGMSCRAMAYKWGNMRYNTMYDWRRVLKENKS